MRERGFLWSEDFPEEGAGEPGLTVGRGMGFGKLLRIMASLLSTSTSLVEKGPLGCRHHPLLSSDGHQQVAFSTEA